MPDIHSRRCSRHAGETQELESLICTATAGYFDGSVRRMSSAPPGPVMRSGSAIVKVDSDSTVTSAPHQCRS